MHDLDDCSTFTDIYNIETVCLMTDAKWYTSHETLYNYNELGWQIRKMMCYVVKLSKMFTIINGVAPTYVFELVSQFELQGTHNKIAHSQGNFTIPNTSTTSLKKPSLL